MFLWYSLCYVVFYHYLLQKKLTLLKNKVITLKKVIIRPKMFFLSTCGQVQKCISTLSEIPLIPAGS